MDDEYLFDPAARGLDGTATSNERVTIKTYSGRIVDPFEMTVDDIDLDDIAHALSSICRFGGHTRHFYSVAQHSVYVAEYVCHRDPENHVRQKTALLHDAVEAYLGDLVRPLKRRPEMAVYLEVETELEQVIAKKFGLEWPFPEIVHIADNAVLQAELDFGRNHFGMPPAEAEAMFREKYEDITFRQGLVPFLIGIGAVGAEDLSAEGGPGANNPGSVDE